ncbi:hypothetical protein SFRURICE_008602, partial [Spodoptera frugiperda]
LSALSIAAVRDLHIILLYIPPDASSIPSQLDSIIESLTNIQNSCDNHDYIFLGDFNLPCLTWSDEGFSTINDYPQHMRIAATTFADSVGMLGFTQYNFIPNCNNRTLDLCFSTTPIIISQSDDPLLREDAYHPALILTATDLFLTPLREVHMPRPNFYRGNYKELNDYFSKIDWDEVLAADLLDDVIDAFYKEINVGVERFIPLNNKLKHRRYPVWYSRSLIKIIREKTKMHIKWKKYENPRDYQEFSILRARQHSIQKSCFNNYMTLTEKNIRNSPKTFWTYVKSKRGGSQYPKAFTVNDKTYEDGNGICTAFGEYFHSVFAGPSAHLSTSVGSTCTTSELVEGSSNMLDMLLLFDILRGKIDSGELLSCIEFCTQRSRTRHTHLFSVPSHRSNYGSNAVMTRLPRLYIDKFESLDIFHLSKLSFRKSLVEMLTDS